MFIYYKLIELYGLSSAKDGVRCSDYQEATDIR